MRLDATQTLEQIEKQHESPAHQACVLSAIDAALDDVTSELGGAAPTTTTSALSAKAASDMDAAKYVQLRATDVWSLNANANGGALLRRGRSTD